MEGPESLTWGGVALPSPKATFLVTGEGGGGVAWPSRQWSWAQQLAMQGSTLTLPGLGASGGTEVLLCLRLWGTRGHGTWAVSVVSGSVLSACCRLSSKMASPQESPQVGGPGPAPDPLGPLQRQALSG